MIGNPFKILGLAPSVFARLDEHNVSAIVRSQYKTLSVIHHPDRGGDREMFESIMWAEEQLDAEKDVSRFRYWYDMYTKPRKDQIATLEVVLQECEKKMAEVEMSLVRFWTAFALGNDSQHVTTFNIKPTRFLINDLLRYNLDYQVVRESRGKGPIPVDTLMDACDSYEILLDTAGHLSKVRVVKEFFDPAAISPDVPDGWFGQNMKKHYYWKRVGEPIPLVGTRLLGTMKQRGRDFFEGRRVTGMSLISGELSSDDFDRASSGYPIEYFRKYLPHLAPNIEKDSWLIGVCVGEEGPRFLLLGIVRAYSVL